MRIIQTRLARQDILDRALFIANENPDAGRRFFNAVKQTTEFIATSPNIGKKISEKENLRMWFVKGFEKHLIFYTVRHDELHLERVIHSRMDYTEFLPE